jgi:Pyruvate/2-oxoacid:ferredoxin oxidoreductase delta subunit
MDEQEFRNKLSEVAEWRIPDILERPTVNLKRTGRKSKEDLYQEQHEEEFAEMFDGVNPTYPVALLSVKKATDCEDCGQHCPKGRVIDAVVINGPKKSFWRKKCKACGLTQDPYTKEYCLTGAEVTHRITSYGLDRNPRDIAQKAHRLAPG